MDRNLCQICANNLPHDGFIDSDKANVYSITKNIFSRTTFQHNGGTFSSVGRKKEFLVSYLERASFWLDLDGASFLIKCLPACPWESYSLSMNFVIIEKISYWSLTLLLPLTICVSTTKITCIMSMRRVLLYKAHVSIFTVSIFFSTSFPESYKYCHLPLSLKTSLVRATTICVWRLSQVWTKWQY